MNTLTIFFSGVTGLSKKAFARVCAVFYLLSLRSSHPRASSQRHHWHLDDQTGAVLSSAKVDRHQCGDGRKSFATTSTAAPTHHRPESWTYTVLIEQDGFQSAALNNILVDPGGRRSTADAVSEDRCRHETC